MSANTSSERNVSIPAATVEAIRDEPEHAVLPSSFAEHEPEIWAVASELDTMDGSSPTIRAPVRDRFDAPTASRPPPPSPSTLSVSSQSSSSPIVGEPCMTFEDDRDYAAEPGNFAGRTSRLPQRGWSFDREPPWLRETSPIRFPLRCYARPERAVTPPRPTSSPEIQSQTPMYQTMRYSPSSGFWKVERNDKIESENDLQERSRTLRYRLHPSQTVSNSEIARNLEREGLSAYADERSAKEIENSIPRLFSVILMHTRSDGDAQSVRCIGLRDNVAAALKLVEDIANDPSLHGRTIEVTVQGEDSHWQDPFDGCVISTSPGVVQVMIERVRSCRNTS